MKKTHGKIELPPKIEKDKQTLDQSVGSLENPDLVKELLAQLPAEVIDLEHLDAYMTKLDKKISEGIYSGKSKKEIFEPILVTKPGYSQRVNQDGTRVGAQEKQIRTEGGSRAEQRDLRSLREGDSLFEEEEQRSLGQKYRLNHLDNIETEDERKQDVDQETGLPKRMTQEEINLHTKPANNIADSEASLEASRKRVQVEKKQRGEQSKQRKATQDKFKKYLETRDRSVLPEAIQQLSDESLFGVMSSVEEVEKMTKDAHKTASVTPESLLDGEARHSVRRIKNTFEAATKIKADNISHLDITPEQLQDQVWWSKIISDWGEISNANPRVVIYNGEPHNLVTTGEPGEFLLEKVESAYEEIPEHASGKTKINASERYYWRPTGDFFTSDTQSLARELASGFVSWESPIIDREETNKRWRQEKDAAARQDQPNATGANVRETINMLELGKQTLLDVAGNAYRYDGFLETDGKQEVKLLCKMPNGENEIRIHSLDDFSAMIQDESYTVGTSPEVEQIDALRAMKIDDVVKKKEKSWSSVEKKSLIGEEMMSLDEFNVLQLDRDSLARAPDRNALDMVQRQFNKTALMAGNEQAYVGSVAQPDARYSDIKTTTLKDLIADGNAVLKGFSDRAPKLKEHKDKKYRDQFRLEQGGWLYVRDGKFQILQDGYKHKVQRQVDDASAMKSAIESSKKARDRIEAIDRGFESDNYKGFERALRTVEYPWQGIKLARANMSAWHADLLMQNEKNKTGIERTIKRLGIKAMPVATKAGIATGAVIGTANIVGASIAGFALALPIVLGAAWTLNKGYKHYSKSWLGKFLG